MESQTATDEELKMLYSILHQNLPLDLFVNLVELLRHLDSAVCNDSAVCDETKETKQSVNWSNAKILAILEIWADVDIQ